MLGGTGIRVAAGDVASDGDLNVAPGSISIYSSIATGSITTVQATDPSFSGDVISGRLAAGAPNGNALTAVQGTGVVFQVWHCVCIGQTPLTFYQPVTVRV